METNLDHRRIYKYRSLYYLTIIPPRRFFISLLINDLTVMMCFTVSLKKKQQQTLKIKRIGGGTSEEARWGNADEEQCLTGQTVVTWAVEEPEDAVRERRRRRRGLTEPEISDLGVLSEHKASKRHWILKVSSDNLSFITLSCIIQENLGTGTCVLEDTTHINIDQKKQLYIFIFLYIILQDLSFPFPSWRESETPPQVIFSCYLVHTISWFQTSFF